MAKITSALQNQWLKSLVLVVVGLWWLILPGSVYSVIKWVLVVGLLAAAVPNLVAGLKLRRNTGNGGWVLNKGIALAVAALLCAVFLAPVLSMVPALIGIAVIIYGIDRIRSAKADQRFVNSSPWPQILYGVVLIVAGAILVFNPFHAVLVMFQVTGAMMLVAAVLNLIGKRKA